MSEISRLAKDFKKRSTEQAESTEKAVQNVFKKHESVLKAELEKSEKRTSSAIRAHSRRLRRIALKSWMAVTIPVLLTLLLGSGVLWSMSWYMSQQIDEIVQNRETLEKLKDQGGAVEMTYCTKKDRLCAKIAEPDGKGYGKNGQYRILKGY